MSSLIVAPMIPGMGFQMCGHDRMRNRLIVIVRRVSVACGCRATGICGKGLTGSKTKVMTRLGLDPRTLSVLTIRDNQLHHPATLLCVCIIICNVN